MPISSYLLLFFLAATAITAAQAQQPGQNATVSCPLDFTVLHNLVPGFNSLKDVSVQCSDIKNGLNLVNSDYLQRTGNFLAPINAAKSCWSAYQTVVDRVAPNFKILSSCGFETDWISEGCMNITTKSELEKLIPQSIMNSVVSNCNQSLANGSPCAACTNSLSSFQVYLTGSSVGNLSDCLAYPTIYAAAFANQFGPTDPGTALCLFSYVFAESGNNNKKKGLIAGVSIVCIVGVLVIFGGLWYLWRKRAVSNRKKEKDREAVFRIEMGLESIHHTTNLFRFTFDEIKKATRNFSRDNIIGSGGYGNVYKGFLNDGSEVAMKRFKNCSAAGDANFTHEVEVIASVRHVNLVALRGYCIATTQLEGHQRIIVCDLMKNGSVYDHLFGFNGRKLSWPLRKKIALGTARGLAYLHFGVQPAIFHRDIKASNILLDDEFEAKLGDFGLAKFTQEGFTHLTTRAAGTIGYVAPEYALYGHLTDRSDVYSFGVLLLELLSGRKALILSEDKKSSLVTDWAWSLVREGRALDVIEDGMSELDTPEVLEKYIMIAILCSHPQLHARPMMDQVVKMLETEQSVPIIPERPISLVAEMVEIEKSMSSNSGSGYPSSFTGYQPFTEISRHSSHKE